MCTTVLFNNSKWEKQHDNKLIAPQEVKLCCGIRVVNTLWGPESKSWNYLTQISYPYASRAKVDNFVQNFWKVPYDVHWLILAVSNFYVKRIQYLNHWYPCSATLDFCMVKSLLLGRSATSTSKNWEMLVLMNIFCV